MSPVVTPPPGKIDVAGLIRGESNSSLRISLGLTDIIGDANSFYVRKAMMGPTSFVYEWLLRLEPSDTSGDITITVNGVDPLEGSSLIWCENRFRIRDLLAAQRRGKPVFVIGTFTPSLRLSSDSSIVSAVEHGAAPFGFLSSPAIAQMSTPYHRISMDTARAMVKQYSRIQDAAANAYIRQSIATAAPVGITYSLADTLKRAVGAKQRPAAMRYASLLSGQQSLGQFTSVGEYKALFDSVFYAGAAEVLHTGDEYEARSMALFLRRLQDSRSVRHVFGEFLHSQNERGQELCLYVLEGFAHNTSAYLRTKIQGWLEGALRQQQSPRVTASLQQTLALYRRGATAGE